MPWPRDAKARRMGRSGRPIFRGALRPAALCCQRSLLSDPETLVMARYQFIPCIPLFRFLRATIVDIVLGASDLPEAIIASITPTVRPNLQDISLSPSAKKSSDHCCIRDTSHWQPKRFCADFSFIEEALEVLYELLTYTSCRW